MILYSLISVNPIIKIKTRTKGEDETPLSTTYLQITY